MTQAEAEVLALSTLKQVMEEKLSATNIELATATVASGKFQVVSKAQLDAVIASLDVAAL